MNVKKLTHSQQQPQAPKAHSQIDLENSVLGTPKVSCLQVLGLGWNQVQDTHSATEDSVENLPETLNLTENAVKHTFKTPCSCFENAPNTDLLFFRQSM